MSFVFEEKRVFWPIWFTQPPTSQIAWKALFAVRETLQPEGAYSNLFISSITVGWSLPPLLHWSSCRGPLLPGKVYC